MRAGGGSRAQTSLTMGVTRSSLLSHLIFNHSTTCFVTASGSCVAVSRMRTCLQGKLLVRYTRVVLEPLVTSLLDDNGSFFNDFIDGLVANAIKLVSSQIVQAIFGKR